MPNIAIVWDFDGTLIPGDSTTTVVNIVDGRRKDNEFWTWVKSLGGNAKQDELNWQHILASDAPIWMYALSRAAYLKQIPLNSEFFREFVLDKIETFPNTAQFLKKLKALEEQEEYKKLGLKIHHFIVSAGLKELVELVFEDGLITYTFGCRYKIIVNEDDSAKQLPESIPVFCMDETMKTRSLFEISKGSFADKDKAVNARVKKEDLWAPFENMIYIGDGDTDVPALSLVRDRGGYGVIVYNAKKSRKSIDEKLVSIRRNKRADFITPADFSLSSKLYKYLEIRCHQIMRRHEASV